MTIQAEIFEENKLRGNLEVDGNLIQTDVKET
jgi:hypothetical protein